MSSEDNGAPETIGSWSYAKTVKMLSRPLPNTMLSSKTLKGQKIVFLPWYRAVKILDKYCPGWCYSVTNTQIAVGTVGKSREGDMEPGTNDRLILTVRMTLTFSDGVVYREATGTEDLSCSGYGDPSSNAESMALRRAASKFGLGLHLYEK